MDVPGAVCAMALATKSFYVSLYKAPAYHDMSQLHIVNLRDIICYDIELS